MAGDPIRQVNPVCPAEVIAEFEFPPSPTSTRPSCARPKRRRPGAVRVPQRAEIIAAIGDVLAERKAHLATLVSREAGKILVEAGGDVQEAIDMAGYIAGQGRNAWGETHPCEMPDKIGFTTRAIRTEPAKKQKKKKKSNVRRTGARAQYPRSWRSPTTSTSSRATRPTGTRPSSERERGRARGGPTLGARGLVIRFGAELTYDRALGGGYPRPPPPPRLRLRHRVGHVYRVIPVRRRVAGWVRRSVLAAEVVAPHSSR